MSKGRGSQRIAAEIAIARLQERQANRALGGGLTALMQAAWALPFILYDWKLLIRDRLWPSTYPPPCRPT